MPKTLEEYQSDLLAKVEAAFIMGGAGQMMPDMDKLPVPEGEPIPMRPTPSWKPYDRISFEHQPGKPTVKTIWNSSDEEQEGDLAAYWDWKGRICFFREPNKFVYFEIMASGEVVNHLIDKGAYEDYLDDAAVQIRSEYLKQLFVIQSSEQYLSHC